MQTQIVGALPVIPHYFERLDLAATIDGLAPWEGDVPLDIVVANRLLQPKALCRVGPWAQTAALTDYYGLTVARFNDDRLGRALERPNENAGDIRAALILKAIEHLELDVSQIHYDLTTVELYGAYEVETGAGQPPPTPMRAYGRTKGGRKHVKQVRLGLDVTGDGGVPVGHLPLDGNDGEVTSHPDNLKLWARTLPRGKLLSISDTKLDAPKDLLAIAASKGQFLCGGALLQQLKERYLGLRGMLKPIDYSPDSQAKRPPEQRDRDEAVEVAEHLEGQVDGKAVGLDYRMTLTWSRSRPVRKRPPASGTTAKVVAEFEAVQRDLGRYSLRTTEAIVRRPESAKGRYPAGVLLDYRLVQEAGGGFTLTWQFDAQALGRWQHLEGVDVLKTDLPERTHPLTEVLRTYKGQSQVERRFHHLKGPLEVAPMSLKNPERIAGLLCVLVWAPMVLALMGRQVRRALKGEPLFGLCAEGRPSPAPTGPLLVPALSGLSIVIVHQGGAVARRLAQPDPTQRRVIQLLRINSERLQTFKLRCGTGVFSGSEIGVRGCLPGGCA